VLREHVERALDRQPRFDRTRRHAIAAPPPPRAARARWSARRSLG
jgi:hypothetical protein